jgi:hypothetical protein
MGDALLASSDFSGAYFIDYGASDHLTPDWHLLHSYVKFKRPYIITAANAGKIYAEGSGALHLKGSAGEVMEITEVLYAPAMSAHLLSLGKLQDQGWNIRLGKNGMTVYDSQGKLIAEVEKRSGVYPLCIQAVPGTRMANYAELGRDPTMTELAHWLQEANVAFVVTAKGTHIISSTLLDWHWRLGHTNFKKVIELAQNDQLPGLDKKDLPPEGEIPGLDTCAACIAGKSKHLPFKVGRERAVRPYERVHVDFLGPMPEESAGGSKYIWLAVDDAT